MDDLAPAPAGHNSQLPYDQAVLLQHDAKARDWMDALGAFLDVGDLTEDQAARLKEWIDGATKLRKGVDADFRAAKAPLDAQIGEVRNAFNPLLNIYEEGIRKAKGALERFLQRKKADEARRQAEAQEAARKEKEEAERARQRAEEANDIVGQVEADQRAKEAEKAARAAEKPAAVNIGSGVGSGRAVSMVTRRVAEVFDYDLAFMEVRHVPAVQAAIDTAIAAIVRGKDFDGRRLRGVRVSTVETVR